MDPAMAVYANALQKMVDAKGDGKSYRDDRRPLNINMKVNEVYAVLSPDNDDYFRTVIIKPNQLTNGFSLHISDPAIYGDPPPGMQVISHHSVHRQMRQMNAYQSLDAFPFKGRDGRS